MPRSDAAGLSVAIFGAMTVLGEEVRRALDTETFAAGRIRLYESPDRSGSLTEFEGEAMFVAAPDEEETSRADLVILCGDADPSGAKYIEWVERGEGAAIDLVGASAGREGVPMVNCDVNPGDLRPGLRLVSGPHPIAHPLSTLLHCLASDLTVEDVCAIVLRPASDRGKPAIEELHQQTVGVLSFSQLPTGVFGRQLAFNLLPAGAGGVGGRSLEAIVGGDVRRVLGSDCPPLSLRVLQAPIFYGHCYLMRVRTGEGPSPADVADMLGRTGLFSISSDPAERTPVDLAARGGVWIADVSRDEDHSGSFWIWMVTDAIRSGAALNAARLARRLTEAPS